MCKSVLHQQLRRAPDDKSAAVSAPPGLAIYVTDDSGTACACVPAYGGRQPVQPDDPAELSWTSRSVIKAHTFEAVLTQRYAKGLTGHVAFSTNRVTENRTVEEYDREPTLWQTNNNGRPWRLTGVGLYELPFGPGRPFLEEGGCSRISLADGA